MIVDKLSQAAKSFLNTKMVNKFFLKLEI